MKRTGLIFVIAFLLTTGIASAQDSMASFRALIQFNKPPASSIGGFVAPEIFAVSHYPLFPKSGQSVVVKANIGSYNSMVPYKVTIAQLTYWKKDGAKTTVDMKKEDPVNGIFSAAIPASKSGEEVFYTVKAKDDWGNVAIELPPDAQITEITRDPEDATINPSMDILGVYGFFNQDGKLRLCMELKDKAKRVVDKDFAAYGLFVFGRDVRYEPNLCESELSSAWLAAYVPNLFISDIVPSSELMSLLGAGKPKEKKAEFFEKGNKFCFTFSPEIVRKDYSVGLKVVGVTLAASLSPTAIKPTDTSVAAMVYPVVHSFKTSD